jgi:heme/copper-type cytochrome/quinol oxidase subunit 1
MVTKIIFYIVFSTIEFLLGFSMIFRPQWWIKIQGMGRILEKYDNSHPKNYYYSHRLKIGGIVLLLMSVIHLIISIICFIKFLN